MLINEIVFPRGDIYPGDESKDKRSTLIAHDDPTVLDDILKNCSDAMAVFGHQRMFKGMRLGEAIYKTDPRLRIRRSANTSNYYTLLMDNLPSWKGYPKRSQSLICSTSVTTAESFASGDTYCVIPFNGANIGVCPGRDLWCVSIANNIEIEQFNNGYRWALLNDSNYSTFINELFAARQTLQEKWRWSAVLYATKAWHKFCYEIAQCESPQDIIIVLNKWYNSEQLGFHYTDITNIPSIKEPGREIWTDSPSYLINIKSKLYFALKRMVSNK